MFFDAVQTAAIVDFSHSGKEAVQTGCIGEQISEIRFLSVIESRELHESLPAGASTVTHLLYHACQAAGVVPRDQIILILKIAVECGRRVSAVLGDGSMK